MNSTQYRPELDGLRALAVLLVLGYHYGFPGLSGGFIGVDVFFVLSGFLITSQMLTGLDGGSDLLDFYARRARRILPVSALVLLATAVGVWSLLGFDRLRDISSEILLSAVFLGNIAAGSGGEYLSGVALPSPVLHYWSLAVEEQFYLVWPLLAAIALRRTHRSAASTLRYLAASALAISLTASVLLTAAHPTWSYYLPHTRIWALAAGALLATWRPRATVAAPLGLLGLLVSLTVIGPETTYPGLAAVLPVLCTCGLISVSPSSVVSKALSIAPLRYIGKLSFAIYLWHWPLLVILEERYGYLALSAKIALALVAIALSAITFHCFENPIRHAAILKYRPLRSFAVLPITVALVAVLPVIALRSPVGAGIDQDTEAISASESPTSTITSLPSSAQLPQGSLPSTMTTGQAPSTSTVYLLGDSTLAELRWFAGASASLQGFSYTLDAESCRKLASKGCEGRERRVPPSAVDTLRTAPLADVLLVMGGYHSHPSRILGEFKATIAAAREAGFRRIIWFSWRESQEFPGVGGRLSMYTSFNETITDELRSGGYNDVLWVDWATYSSTADAWFTKDKIHVNLLGTLALGEYISKVIAHLDSRPCPGTTVGVCEVPTVADPKEDLLSKYDLIDTIEHCYEMGETRSVECKPDRLQVDE
jgi:peptidoglycan/LPS O-acetylase OafA/YrhL